MKRFCWQCNLKENKNRKGNLYKNWEKKMDLLTGKLESIDQNTREVTLTVIKQNEISFMASQLSI